MDTIISENKLVAYHNDKQSAEQARVIVLKIIPALKHGYCSTFSQQASYSRVLTRLLRKSETGSNRYLWKRRTIFRRIETLWHITVCGFIRGGRAMYFLILHPHGFYRLRLIDLIFRLYHYTFVELSFAPLIFFSDPFWGIRPSVGYMLRKHPNKRKKSHFRKEKWLFMKVRPPGLEPCAINSY